MVQKAFTLLAFFTLIAVTSSQSCNILLTNDDGVNSPALLALQSALSQAGHSVLVVSPAEDRSLSSSSRNPIAITSPTTPSTQTFPLTLTALNTYSFAGTPVDAVDVALNTLIPALNRTKPDLVTSGPNFGPNLGIRSVIQSGTVGAALFAAQESVPAVAISLGVVLEEFPDFESTAEAIPVVAGNVARLVTTVATSSGGCSFGLLRDANVAFNVNVPVPVDSIKGFKLTRLGRVSFPGGVRYVDTTGSLAGNGPPVVNLSQVADAADVNDLDGDSAAFVQGFVTVTPVGPDLGVGLKGLRKLLPLLRMVLKAMKLT